MQYSFAKPVCAALLCVSCVAVRGDVILLKNGGEIRGRWLNDKQKPLDSYLIETEYGRIQVDSRQVVRTVRKSSTEVEYESMASRTSNTVDEQWKLAEWCRQKKLRKQREKHLRRIIALDPDHLPARRGLGYSQVRGRWMTREDFQAATGIQFYKGRWRLPQEIALLKARSDVEREEKNWLAKLRRWREMLGTDKAKQAYQQIAAINDPQAAKATGILLREETHRQVKMLLINVLARIGDEPSIQTLQYATLHDPDEEVFHACLEKLIALDPPGITAQYASALKDENNVRINRAAYALGRFNDRTVLSPLIDALVTTHFIVIPGGNSESYTASFISPGGKPRPPNSLAGTAGANAAPIGGTGISAGDKTKVIPRVARNEDVLTALVRLSGGENFGFDREAWRYWLASENNRVTPVLNARRDDR